MTWAGSDMTVDGRQVKTIAFLDDSISTVNAVIVKPNQILQGPMTPRLERWAAGDGVY